MSLSCKGKSLILFIMLVFILSCSNTFADEMPGDIIINTDPQGAFVTRDDGIIEGLTPVEIILLEPGEHTFVFELAEHLTLERKLNVESGTRVSYDVDLVSTDGMIVCPHCKKLFHPPVKSPSKYKRGTLFKEINFLIYEGTKYLGPFNSGLIGLLYFENNWESYVKNEYDYNFF